MPHNTPEKRRAYARAWRAKHPGYCAEHSRKQRIAHPNAAREEYLRNKADYVARSKAWQSRNPEKAKKAKQKALLKARTANPEYFRQKTRDWRASNPERWRQSQRACQLRRRDVHNAKRRADGKLGKRVDEKARRKAQLLSNEKADCSKRIRLLRLLPFCQYCFKLLGRGVRRTIDHVIPVSRGGGHVPDNLVAACGSCNSSKADKLLCEWSGPIWEAV